MHGVKSSERSIPIQKNPIDTINEIMLSTILLLVQVKLLMYSRSDSLKLTENYFRCLIY